MASQRSEGEKPKKLTGEEEQQERLRVEAEALKKRRVQEERCRQEEKKRRLLQDSEGNGPRACKAVKTGVLNFRSVSSGRSFIFRKSGSTGNYETNVKRIQSEMEANRGSVRPLSGRGVATATRATVTAAVSFVLCPTHNAASGRKKRTKRGGKKVRAREAKKVGRRVVSGAPIHGDVAALQRKLEQTVRIASTASLAAKHGLQGIADYLSTEAKAQQQMQFVNLLEQEDSPRAQQVRLQANASAAACPQQDGFTRQSFGTGGLNEMVQRIVAKPLIKGDIEYICQEIFRSGLPKKYVVLCHISERVSAAFGIPEALRSTSGEVAASKKCAENSAANAMSQMLQAKAIGSQSLTRRRSPHAELTEKIDKQQSR